MNELYDSWLPVRVDMHRGMPRKSPKICRHRFMLATVCVHASIACVRGCARAGRQVGGQVRKRESGHGRRGDLRECDVAQDRGHDLRSDLGRLPKGTV